MKLSEERSRLLRHAAEQYQTPTFVYFLDKISERYEQLKNAVDYPGLRIHYAMKANFNPHVIRHLLAIGSGIDSVSPEEIILAKRLGCQPANIIYTANNLTEAEMMQVKDEAVLFNLGSTGEIAKFGKLFPGQKICLRINPDVVAGAHVKIQTGGPVSKFGILLSQIPEVIDICQQSQLTVVGLHIHTGSGIKNQADYFRAVDNLLRIAEPANFPDLEFLDFGGGLFVPYHPEEQEINYESFGQTLKEKIGLANAKYKKDLSLYLEPGKFLVAESGVFLTTVSNVKDNAGYLIAGTNSGFNHLPRPVLYDAYHQIYNLSANSEAKHFTYDVVGNICETGDNFATRRELPELRADDLLAIANAGAYCYSMSSRYNLRLLPTELVVTPDNELVASRIRQDSSQFINELLNEYNA